MGFDFEKNKTNLLYADLFKQEEIRDNSSAWRSPSSSACDSSSSGFTTPFGSELGSTESDGGADFAAELSRQMAEFMLHEEEEEAKENKPVCKYGFNMNRPVLHHANRTPCSKVLLHIVIDYFNKINMHVYYFISLENNFINDCDTNFNKNN